MNVFRVMRKQHTTLYGLVLVIWFISFTVSSVLSQYIGITYVMCVCDLWLFDTVHFMLYVHVYQSLNCQRHFECLNQFQCAIK